MGDLTGILTLHIELKQSAVQILEFMIGLALAHSLLLLHSFTLFHIFTTTRINKNVTMHEMGVGF